ncbi:Uncharacterised protein [Yersinia enterocolitica]|nr:Uncharacterised protein [Yersinia enterocolitica]
MAGFTHDSRARVMIFIHAVTKAHQAERVIFIFGAADKFWNVFNGFNLFQHFQTGFVRTAVSWPP